MLNFRRRVVTVVSVALAAVFFVGAGPCMAGWDAHFGRGMRAKNVIFMVPDGMGISYVTAARIFQNGPDGDPLTLETLEQIGYQRTHSRNSTVTDSAAAASAWASGAKYNNGEVSCHDNDFDGVCDGKQVKTALQIAQAMGKSTGLVASSGVTHATPAAFGAQVHNRKCEEEIAIQYINNNIDVVLGGGIAANRSTCKLPHSTGDWLEMVLKHAVDTGYSLATTRDEMNAAVAAGAPKLMGLFTPGGKTPEYFRYDASVAYPEAEPTLPEMTKAALDLLEKDRDGFFLVIEGSQIDWSGHANDIGYLIGEMLAFDESVEVVLDWVAQKRLRKLQTLIVIVGDHETGGMMINGPYGTLSVAGDTIKDGWTTGGHTAQDTIIWSQGPGSRKLGKAVDNTDLYEVMIKAMKGKCRPW